MRKLFLLLASVAILAISCKKSPVEPDQKDSIVGEWSGLREGEQLIEGRSDVFIHFNFKADGTYEQIMPAWEEINYGKYTIEGDLVSFELTSIDWLWDRGNGYDNVYDQYGCYWYPDKFDENRTQIADPFAKFCQEWPERAHSSARFSFDAEGNLLLKTESGEPTFNLDLVFHKNPGYKPERRPQ